MKRLKQKWGISSNLQLFVILLVFSITGSLVLLVSDPIMDIIGADKHRMNLWLYYPLRISIIFIVYQILILIIGALFGQFDFFWRFVKKFLISLGFTQFKQKQ